MPEVVITTTALLVPVLIPRAKKAADLSSMELISFNLPISAKPPAAIARGPDLLPGHKTIHSNPFAIKAFRSLIHPNKFVRAKDRA